MAVTQTTRLGLTRWTDEQGGDPFRRAQLDADHGRLEDLVAGWLPDSTEANRPAPAAANARMLHRSTDSGVLAYSTGAAWVDLAASSDVTAHTGDADDAHDASAISYDGTASGLAAGTVQTAIDEVDTNLDDHLADVADAHDASAISFAPAGALAGTDVQAAIEELDAEKETPAGAQAKVDAAVANLLDSAPGALDTLNELAAALGDDPNFATTVNNALAVRVRSDQPEAAGSDLKDVLVTKGLLTDGGATPLNLDGGSLTAANVTTTGQVLAADGTSGTPGLSFSGSTAAGLRRSGNNLILQLSATIVGVQVTLTETQVHGGGAGTPLIRAGSTGLGFYGGAQVAKPGALTAEDASAVNSGDATTDAVIVNIRTRLGELEDNLQALGLQT